MVYETNSEIYKLAKDTSLDEYEIPDLWKLKQSNELEQVLLDLQILEGTEPQSSKKTEKIEQTDEQNGEPSGLLSDIFKKEKKPKKKNEQDIKDEQIELPEYEHSDEKFVKSEQFDEQIVKNEHFEEEYYGEHEYYYNDHGHFEENVHLEDNEVCT